MEEELKARLQELLKDSSNLAGHAEEALEYFAKGDLKGVAQVVAISHYKIAQVSSEREGILDFLKHRGVTPK